MKKISFVLLSLFSFTSISAQADVAGAEEAARNYGASAKKLNPKSTLSAKAGRAFYTKKVVDRFNSKDVSCSSCHTDNPASEGKHKETGKPIQPLAPSVNPERFSDASKTERNFSKHCRDLYKKDCSDQDKGDYVTYLLTVK